jgi:hypothetical protein
VVVGLDRGRATWGSSRAAERAALRRLFGRRESGRLLGMGYRGRAEQHKEWILKRLLTGTADEHVPAERPLQGVEGERGDGFFVVPKPGCSQRNDRLVQPAERPQTPRAEGVMLIAVWEEGKVMQREQSWERKKGAFHVPQEAPCLFASTGRTREGV